MIVIVKLKAVAPLNRVFQNEQNDLNHHSQQHPAERKQGGGYASVKG